MTFQEILKGLNDGGFAFLGMVLVAFILVGAAKLGGWIVNKGWPEFMANIRSIGQDSKEAATIYQSATQSAIEQGQRLIERQSIMQDSLMAQTKDMADSHKVIIGKLDTLIDKVGESK